MQWWTCMSVISTQLLKEYYSFISKYDVIILSLIDFVWHLVWQQEVIFFSGLIWRLLLFSISTPWLSYIYTLYVRIQKGNIYFRRCIIQGFSLRTWVVSLGFYLTPPPPPTPLRFPKIPTRFVFLKERGLISISLEIPYVKLFSNFFIFWIYKSKLFSIPICRWFRS